MRFLLLCTVLASSCLNCLCLYDGDSGTVSVTTSSGDQITVTKLKPINSTEPVRERIDNSQPCLSGWIHQQNNCYKLFNTELKTFDEAEVVCRSYESHLTSVTTSAEHDFLIDYILREVKTDDLKYVWVGSKRFKTRYMWMDLEPFSYARWHPAHTAYTEVAKPDFDCVQFVTTAGHYKTDDNFGNLVNHPCSGKDNFICKQKSKATKYGLG